MCEHGYTGFRAVMCCIDCGKTEREIVYEQQLTAARAELAELRKDNERQKRLVTISRLCKNVQSFRAKQAEAKILQMEDAIKFDMERFFEFQRRADQAEAQCAAMRLRFEKYVRENCKLIRHSIADGLGKPDDVDGKCGGYAQNGDEPHYICQECVAAYDPEADYDEGVVVSGSALLAELQRYRSLSASSSAQRVTAGEVTPITRMIKINGHVEVTVSHDEFMDRLIAFVEANGWTFGGVTDEVKP